ncbi:PCNA-interacting partner [Phyllostomus hastatus]|uniref:PCNA-interacting partner n=1 Tax=Phyllostomus hastatus TaxID=9423 RepID=UPI001E680D98|nr:PCNA-interacting partner [Phyllostomus hastatus]XP_045682611.1 PCNA-interacting partner [Phyllostomus hastatus]XP_045682612.1 PCNA-interacting partner [Phyllostomus hastatus]
MAALQQRSVLAMIKEFRRNWHTLCDSERTTVCGADAMLLALQLCMAENSRQHGGEFTVSLSDVLLTWKHLLHEKLNLPFGTMEVIDHYEDIRRTYDSFLKNSNMLDLIDVYKKCSVLTSNCENNANISASQLRDFLSGRQSAAEDETDLCVAPSPVSEHSQDNEKVKLLAKKMIYSYLNLLVNSKNDLALAHILNVPDRGLGREAFTDLKHAAREKQMSMFLVATSFIRTIELGGKGYAPSPSDPLRTHVKGLSNFINFIDKLDEILGEIPNPSIAGGRILSVIKMQLTKGQNSRDPFHNAVEEVAQDLDLRIKNITNSQQGDVAVSTTDISPARMKQTLIRSQFSCTYKDDGLISRNTWNNVNSTSKPSRVLHMENDLSESVNSSVGRPTIGTSAGNVHLDRSKNAKVERKSSSQTGNKSSKRKQVDLDDENILCDNGNEPPRHKNVKIPKTSNDLQNKLDGKLARVAKSNKCTAKDKLITGQTKLTQFFRL